jgi:hypothetical protein
MQRFAHLKRLELAQRSVAPYPDAEAKVRALLPTVEIKFVH